MNERTERPSEDKSSILLRIKKTLKIGKKESDKESTSATIDGKSPQTSHRNLKTLTLKAPHKLKKPQRTISLGSQEEAPSKSDVAFEEVSASSSCKEVTEKARLDVGISEVNSEMPEGGRKKISEEEEEQLRLYKAMHEIRKQMILKEKEFQEEKLEFYKLQLEAENLLGQSKLHE